MSPRSNPWVLPVLMAAACLFAGSSSTRATDSAAERVDRKGDEIVIAGQLFHTGTTVVLWMDPGGYDAYRVERRFAPWDDSSYAQTTKDVKEIRTPNRYGVRFEPTTRPEPVANPLTAEQLEKVRGGGWPLELCQEKIDQIVFHYDECGTSRQCFRVLQDLRGLSCHFLLDLDGTIYQTLDVKERAWHATTSNDRAVGIEIANVGAYRSNDTRRLDDWYKKDESGKLRVVLSEGAKSDWIRMPNFIARPGRNERIVGEVQSEKYVMYDYTPQQYEALIKLTAALCTVLPRINPDYPKDAQGKLITRTLPRETLEKYRGLIGHYHIQADKQDPGPAFQWDKVVNGVRQRMNLKPLPAGDVINMPK